ncbi:MAG: glycosyltransferase family 2 protein [Cypionkella sp.]|nr:glycosyltransferase family 2 protein [Cypionkella sp.]
MSSKSPDPTIITLSCIPPRFGHLGPTLDSLLAQDLPAAQIILYIPQRYRRFPDWDGTLPSLPAGVTLRRTEDDYGPATKILPAVREFAGQSVDLLYCDDDMIYDRSLNRLLKDGRATHPNAALCPVAYDLPGSAQRRQPRVKRWGKAAMDQHLADPSKKGTPLPLVRASGYADVMAGWGSVMVRPEFFDDRVFDIPSNLWMVDDPWLSGHLALRRVPIWACAETLPPRRREHVQRDIAPLFFAVIDGKSRQDSDAACVAHYRALGVWNETPPPSVSPPPVAPLRRLARAILPHRVRAFLVGLGRR